MEFEQFVLALPWPALYFNDKLVVTTCNDAYAFRANAMRASRPFTTNSRFATTLVLSRDKLAGLTLDSVIRLICNASSIEAISECSRKALSGSHLHAFVPDLSYERPCH